ncbi:MAG TPA: TonB-dependent receptor [Aliidongia sp.]|uniref:TonB-dependent receptor n=1 Tax=Aliidongia sp. TaxID=1914230 RepID=UPI002DDDB7CC|nr:TonB-dependent receptor [Aliidongia sp.]HEV2677424.1 TonB-dependent receptor [Aliidongia sp.]
MRRSGILAAAVLASTTASAIASAQVAPTPPPVETITVVGTTPLPGAGIDRDKVPSNVQVLSDQDLHRDGTIDLAGTLGNRLSSVNLTPEQGNPLQPDFQYRGFDASPILGAEDGQGLAVYQNGVRINEAFGDLMNWDLVPQFAVNRTTLFSADPVFGLNAIGGALVLEMKNGFNAPGGSLELSGGSFGRIVGTAQWGIQSGDFASYVGVRGYADNGFRDHSLSAINQVYADVGAETGQGTLHLSYAGSSNNLQGVGPTPVELLDQDRSAVFTYPQSIRNDASLLTLSGSYKPLDQLTLNGTLYYRRFSQRLVDGNTTDASDDGCANPTDNPDGAFLCLGTAGNTLYDRTGHPVPDFLAAAIASGGNVTYGEIDRTETDTDGLGGTLQATLTRPFLGHGNHLAIGGSLDHGDTSYRATSELGSLGANLLVNGSGFIIDQLANPESAAQALDAGLLIGPTSLQATNDYYGLYLTDTFDVTDTLSITVNGRYNLARIDLSDRLGTGLNGHHRYDRFNPGGGITYKVASWMTVYASYSEANRVPTPGELACADPTRPCILDGFLVADPDLKQVVARTYEAGVRGKFGLPALDGRVTWNLGLFRTSSENDILDVATASFSTGQGYFTNAGSTRRQGIEAGFGFKSADWSFDADYSLIDATFRTRISLPSNSPFADPDTGDITVLPGNRLPLIPRHRLSLSAEYQATSNWQVGADLKVQSSEYLQGDDSNQGPRIDGSHVVNLHSSWAITENVTLFGEIDNLFGEKYYSFGGFTQLDGLPPSFQLSDTRTFNPAAPRAFFAGLRATF